MRIVYTINEDSLYNDLFFQQLQVAVISAVQNTTLQPYLLYDGLENSRLTWLQSMGVSLLPHRLSYIDQLTAYIRANHESEDVPRVTRVRAGSCLRMELPIALKTHGCSDEYILYTDADVIFLNEVNLDRVKPRYLAALGLREGGLTRLRIGGWTHFNAGVLVMNVKTLYGEVDRYRAVVLANGGDRKRRKGRFMQKNLFMSDQVAINLYFKHKIDMLDEVFNWSPSRGINEQARIVHFNGLKWTEWDEFCAGQLSQHRMRKFERTVGQNRDAYGHYVGIAKEYLSKVEAATS